MDYTTATEEFLRAGLTVFQGAMLADTEAAHCDKLYDMIRPTGVVVDMGCGIGGVSAAFKARDAALTCIGITNSQLQVARALPGVEIRLADMADTGLDAGVADVVMFNESFGYGVTRQLLDEAFRLLRPDGVLAIKDFNFVQHSPVIGQCEKQWGYTVHSPEALTGYARAAGFSPRKQWRRLDADFSRWHQFMRGYSQAAEHAHTPHGANIKAAVYTFTKATTASAPKLTLADAMQGDVAAIAFCGQLHRILHTWDDIVDGDPTNEPAVNDAFHDALVALPMNPFYAANAYMLAPILSAGIAAWEAANVFERRGDREDWNKAHMLRVHVGAVFVACAEIVGGRAWARRVAPDIYSLVQGDPLEKYIDELEARHAHSI